MTEKSDSDNDFKALDGISDDTSDLESEASQLHRRLDLKTDEGFYNALRKYLTSNKKNRTHSALMRQRTRAVEKVAYRHN